MPLADNIIPRNVDINSFIWPEMLIGQISIIGHNAVQCFAFYVIICALNKTVTYSEIKADKYGEILCRLKRCNYRDMEIECCRERLLFAVPGEV